MMTACDTIDDHTQNQVNDLVNRLIKATRSFKIRWNATPGVRATSVAYCSIHVTVSEPPSITILNADDDSLVCTTEPRDGLKSLVEAIEAQIDKRQKTIASLIEALDAPTN